MILRFARSGAITGPKNHSLGDLANAVLKTLSIVLKRLPHVLSHSNFLCFFPCCSQMEAPARSHFAMAANLVSAHMRHLFLHNYL